MTGPQPQAPTRLANELIPGLRPSPTDDGLDHARIKLVVERWDSQDQALIPRDRMVDEQCRVLMGDMWSVWSPALGKVVNLADSIGAPELLWRELPRVNMCQKWFGLTVARLTENSPVLGAEPRDSSSESLALADASDVILPKIWDDLSLSAKVFEMTGWMAAAGWSFHKLSAETSTGAVVPMVGPAVFTAPDGTEVPVEHAAFNQRGEPMGRITPGDVPGGWSYELDDSDQPGQLTEGNLVSSVLNPLEVRGEWGNGTPWQQKRWHIHRGFYDQAQIFEAFGVLLPPDTTVQGGASGQSFYQLKLDRGAGSYGANDAQMTSGWGTTGPQAELCELFEMWERPSKAFPDGRLLVCSRGTVLHDGPRPFTKLKEYGYTSPITYVEWMRQPSQPYGSTPLSLGLPINRQYNAGYRQLLLHRAKCSNPVLWYNANIFSKDDVKLLGKPGSSIGVEINPMQGMQPPAGYIQPASISMDVYKIQEQLKADFESIMGLSGAEGIAQGSDASGEQVKELRFNSDRPISVPVKNLASALEEIGNLAFCILPVIWPAPKLLHYIGGDNLAKSMTILPEFWDGQCSVRVDAESMIPRSRQEREAAALNKFQLGVYGPPGSPQATQGYMEQAGFPDRDKSEQPGDIDAKTMNYLIGQIMQGVPAMQIVCLQQYNYGVMKKVLRDHMSAKAFIKEDPQIQAQLQMFWMKIEQCEMVQAVQESQRLAQVQGAVLQQSAPLQIAQAHVAGAVNRIAAPPPPPEPTSQD